MKSKHITLALIPYILVIILSFSGLVTSDLDQDKQKCANQLVGMATCLTYVSGESNAPPIDCCTGLKLVIQNNPECLCLIIKDRNDPNLGLKINATRALGLPTVCKASGSNISECPALLHLPPNSPDAKVFEDYVHNNANKNNATAPSSATATAPAAAELVEIISDGGKTRKRGLGIKMVLVLLLPMVVLHNLFNH